MPTRPPLPASRPTAPASRPTGATVPGAAGSQSATPSSGATGPRAGVARSRGHERSDAEWSRGSRGAGAPSAPLSLRLAIGREGIGLELAEPVEIACLRVVELSTTLPGMRFPVDVSGGVTRFRHRRGDLQTLLVEVAARDVERWMAPRLRGLVGTQVPDVWIEVGPARSTVCVAAPMDADESAPAAGRLGASPASQDTAVVAFDVHALAEGEDVVLVVANARGAGLPEPATAIALGCLDALVGAIAERSGAIFRLRRPAMALARALLPPAGARVPSTDAVRWAALSADAGTWVLHASRGADAAVPTQAALLAREIAALLAPGDDALVRGDLVDARARYLDVLERAPRHPEVAARMVDIDARMPARAEAALATLAESMVRAPGAGTGIVAGELLAQVGDVDAALATFERAGEAERAPALAARAFELAARTSRDPEAAARWLDRALARSPRSIQARWARVTARLALGRLEDALADVEHLEALARGSRRKYAVWLRAGTAWAAAGLAAQAGAVFERALRYAPDEPGALVGLGVALLHEGREARGVSLLDRALEVARSRGEPEPPILLALARALAERLDDLPTAIAHASAIPASAAEALVARGLEGRWRARLGDLAGAALAFARLRDFAASLAPFLDGASAIEVVALLLEAATFERDRRADPLAAQRHLAAALRLVPHHGEARKAYRDVGALLVRSAGALQESHAHGEESEEGERDEIESRESPPTERYALRRPSPGVLEGQPLAPFELEPAPARSAVIDLALAEEVEASDEDVVRAGRVEELTRRLRDNPADDGVADELAALLEDLGRGHELVALFAARLEDATPERRPRLAADARKTFERMASKADASGQAADAVLYRDALSSLSVD
jgi:tetratricopeptide (TPR) repeat protein